MKQLKFNPSLMPIILNGQKTTTWRLFDDKNLTEGDTLEFLNSETKQKFAEAEIVKVVEKKISDIDETDRVGHYEELYKRPISPDETIKIIRFKLKTA